MKRHKVSVEHCDKIEGKRTKSSVASGSSHSSASSSTAVIRARAKAAAAKYALNMQKERLKQK